MRPKRSTANQLVFRLLAWTSMVLGPVPGLGTTFASACQENAMLVFDASGSMRAFHDGMTKIDTARKAAGDVLPAITRRRPTGLITYGGERGPSCVDVSLKLPPMVDSGELILAELRLMEPRGQTPLSDAVILAAQTLKGLGQPGVIVLVTDGLENCGYNACVVGRKIRAEAPNIRVHVIGFHLSHATENRIACLARATDGTYTVTHSLETLRDALRDTLSCPRVSRSLPARSGRQLAKLASVLQK